MIDQWSIIIKRRFKLKDYSSMSKEDLELFIKELKDALKVLENAFNDFLKISEHEPSETVARLQEEIKKAKEGIAKFEELSKKNET